MSEFNSIISDRELRELFREKILAEDGDDAFTDKLIDMEAKMVFAAPAVIPVPAAFENAFLSKIGVRSSAKLAGKLSMKWIFTGLSCAAAATSVVIYKTSEPEKQPATAAVTAAAEKDTPENTFFSDTIKSPLPSATPKDVTKQLPEQLSPACPDILSILPAETRVTATETVEGASYAPLAALSELPELLSRMQPLDYVDDETGSPENEDSAYAINKVFSGVKSIEVDSDLGDIKVRSSPNSDVKLTGRIENARETRKEPDLKITYDQQGSHLEVRIQRNRRKQLAMIHKDSELSSLLDLEVPPGTDLVLKAGNGNIHLNNLEGGKCVAESNFGDVRAMNCRTALTASSSSGMIELSGIQGDVKATAAFGDLILSEIKGTIEAHAASGNFIGKRLEGDCTIESGFGDVTVRTMTGKLAADVSSGNTEIDSLIAPQCDITSHFGHVTLRTITAKTRLTVHSGDVKINALTGDLQVGSSFGNVVVNNITGELGLNVTSGNTSITQLNGNLTVGSEYGNVVINGTHGNSTITAGSGNVSAKNMDITERLEVSVSYGNSNIKLKNDYNDLSFNLHTDFGKVKINKGNMKLEKENGVIVVEKGGVQVRGNASSGNITFD